MFWSLIIIFCNLDQNSLYLVQTQKSKVIIGVTVPVVLLVLAVVVVVLALAAVLFLRRKHYSAQFSHKELPEDSKEDEGL